MRDDVNRGGQRVPPTPQPGYPRHVAIIMDGNGRWAEERGLRRTDGHRAGIDSVREVTTAAAELGLSRLTLYAFSTENWKRPRSEISLLMRMLVRFLLQERSTLKDNDIRLEAIGELERLPARVQRVLDETRQFSAGHRGMVLTLALSYGGRQEIVSAARRLAREAALGQVDPEQIDEAVFASHLYDPAMSDPDLMIRTAGEMRISNFLLWQASYSELFISEVCWPEFRREEFHAALDAFTRRRRKFGGLVR